MLVFPGDDMVAVAWERPRVEGGVMLIQFAVAASIARTLLRRECPICGHVQIVPRSRMRDTINCERCGYPILLNPGRRLELHGNGRPERAKAGATLIRTKR